MAGSVSVNPTTSRGKWTPKTARVPPSLNNLSPKEMAGWDQQAGKWPQWRRALKVFEHKSWAFWDSHWVGKAKGFLFTAPCDILTLSQMKKRKKESLGKAKCKSEVLDILCDSGMNLQSLLTVNQRNPHWGWQARLCPQPVLPGSAVLTDLLCGSCLPHFQILGGQKDTFLNKSVLDILASTLRFPLSPTSVFHGSSLKIQLSS